MRNITLTIIFYAWCASHAHAQDTPKNIEATVDSLLTSSVGPQTPGLSIAVINENKLVFSKGYGLANLEYNIPNKPNTIFDIASLTKQFTAFSIAVLIHAGKISLEDDVRKYIPELNEFGEPIRIKHLLSHSSGLRDQNELLYLAGWRQEDVITNEDILSLLFKQKDLNFTPGKQFKYCNSGYTLLALVVERVTHMPFSVWTHENIFKPLGMVNTSFILSNNQLIKNRAYSYSTGELGYEKNTLNSTTIGARGLQSTVEDLTLWTLNFTSHRIGNKEIFELMYKLPEYLEMKYNFGLAFTTYNNLPVIEHDGSDAGYRSYIGRFPGQKFAIILLANASTIDPKRIAMQITDALLFKKLAKSILQIKKSEKIEIPESVEKGMEGQFQISNDKLLTVWADDHTIKATINNEEKIYYLMPVSKTEFEFKELNAIVAFRKGAAHSPDSIVFKQGQSATVLPKIFVEDEQSRKLSEYEGTYYAEELGVHYKITKVNNTLKVALPRNGVISLKKQNGDNFTGSYYWFRRVKFVRNASSEITGFEVSSGRSFNTKFTKQD